MSRKSSKVQNAPDLEFGGLEPQIINDIIDNIPPNPVTGRVEMPDIMKYLTQNPSKMDALRGQMGDAGLGVKNSTISSYDFASLSTTIKRDTFWIIQLGNMGMVDSSGTEIDPAKAGTMEGLRPAFMVYCYDEKGRYRITRESVGLPSSETVLEAIRGAIAQPLPPMKPCLPSSLIISLKLQAHTPNLKPFLDSLPAPFTWRLETPEESDIVNEGVHELNERGVKSSVKLATQKKVAGNAAFSRRDRKGALAAYREAIDHLGDALAQNPDKPDEETVKKALAVCYGNRAAALLMDGTGVDARAALQDAELAEHWDPDYAKGYFRQAKAHQALNSISKAQDVLARALHRPDLENDIGLVDLFIDLQTNGQGLSDDEGVFKQWMLDIICNDSASSERVYGLKGEWKRRCDAQFMKWKK